MKLERRMIRVADLAVRSDEEPTITGHAAVFDQWATIYGFRERIAPGAFKKTLGEADVRALWNHDPNYVLGRNTSGTLELAEDEVGLRIENRPPDTTWARDLMVSMGRGDVDQMSFGFNVVQEEWDEADDGVWERTLREVRLYDVSVVTFPAYQGTDAYVRSADVFIPEPPQAGHSGDDSGDATPEGGAPSGKPGQAAGGPRVAIRRRRLALIESEV